MDYKILIIHNSHTGFTQRYAELIGKELGCPVCALKGVPSDLSQCDIVVFGSRLHAGIFDGWKKARKLLAQRGAKKLVLFATGAMPNEAEDQIQKVWEQNLTPEERQTIPHFYMQAGLCYEKMGSTDRAMMKVAAWAMACKRAKTAEDQAFQNAIASSYDISDPKYIQPIVSCLRQEN